jgi:hypothetical protein
MSALALYRENLNDGKSIIHVGASDGTDYMLCGYAEEGACMGDGQDQPVVPVSRGRISCEKCCSIIRFCKTIPAAKLKSDIR